MKRIILSLCDLTGNMVKPWLEAGYECWIVDLQHLPGFHREGNLIKIGVDVRQWQLPNQEIQAVFAFPPCTHLAVSGARWFQGKGLRKLSEAIDIFGTCVEICERSNALWFCENPVSVISSHFRKPDYIFHPCDYGDPWTKKTCLWVGGGFIMPPKNPVKAIQGSKMHKIPPGPNRANLRSATPIGFAKAVFQSNSTEK